MFKSSNGKLRTNSLFIELNKTKSRAIFSISDEDVTKDDEFYPSLRKIYLSFEDPTEYEFAIETFGSWKQWEALLGNAQLLSYIQDWRDESEVRYRSIALKALVNTAINDGAKGTTAAKYIAEKGWIKRKAGAPSKEERLGQKKIDAAVNQEIQATADRMGLELVK